MSGELPIPQKNSNNLIEIKSLTIAPLPQLRVNCGDAQSFIDITAKTLDIKGIVWNEEKISLLTNDRSNVIQFYPEINPTAVMFLQRKEHRRDRDSDNQVWDGEFEPIQFTKTNLIKFLKNQKTSLPDDVMLSIKNMQVIEKKIHESEMLSLDNDDNRTVIEETSSTNIPKKFSIDLSVSENYIGKFQFEVAVITLKDKYNNETNKKGMVLRCLNAREVLRDMMQQTLSKLPKDIPRYYGRMSISTPEKNIFM